MGDMGDDIGKSLAMGCLVCIVMMCATAGGEYYLFRAFFRPPVTFDSVLLFILISAFFIGAMWRFYKWAVNYV